MKKRKIAISIIIITLSILLIFLYLTKFNYSKIVLKSERMDVCVELNSADTKAINRIFSNAEVYYEDVACGFSDSEVLKFDNKKVLQFALDGDFIFQDSITKIKYSFTKDEDIEELIEILAKYGFEFNSL